MAVDLSTLDFLVVPGRENAPAEHWQSHWLGALPNSNRVLQEDWNRPDVAAWTGRLDAAVASAPRRVVLIGHSVAVATILRWAAVAAPERVAKVAAAFLAAPTNVDDPDPSFDIVRSFAPMPLGKLPFLRWSRRAGTIRASPSRRRGRLPMPGGRISPMSASSAISAAPPGSACGRRGCCCLAGCSLGSDYL
jgi:hypothetical protein